MMKTKFLAAAVVLLLASLTTAPSYALDEERLRVFLDGSDYRNVRLSPDGEHIALITQEDDRNLLVIMNLATMKPTASVKYSESSDMDIVAAEWVNDELVRYRITRKYAMWEQEFLRPDVFLLTVDGKRNKRIWSVTGNYENNSSGSTRDRGKLTRGFPNFLAENPTNENEQLIYVSSIERRDGAGRGGIYRLDLRTGDTNKYSSVPHFTLQVWSNEEASIFVATTRDMDDQKHVLFTRNGVDWENIDHDLDNLSKEFQPVRVARNYLYATAQSGDAIDADTHLIRYDFSSGEWEDVYNIGFAIFEGGYVDDDDGEAKILQWNDGAPKFELLDKTHKVSQVVAAFARSYEGFNINVVSMTDEQDKLLLHLSSGAHPGEYFLFDFATRKAKFLLPNMERIDGNELGELEDATFVASDGVTIPGWFQAPKGADTPPLIVYIHGGPHGPYEGYGFSMIYHLINEMGYAVYAPNFRGSGGYGPNFEYAGYGEWGSRMIDDMYEGAQALIKAGKVNSDRVCTMGWSYGGYGSLQSQVRYNDFYKCGVVLAGVFDLTTMMKLTDISNAWFGDKYMARAIADDPETIREYSPMQNIDKINSSLLIHHGEEDERTPFKDAELFVEALKKSNKRFEYKWYPKEGHGNRNMDNMIDEFQRIDAFLSENL